MMTADNNQQQQRRPTMMTNNDTAWVIKKTIKWKLVFATIPTWVFFVPPFIRYLPPTMKHFLMFDMFNGHLPTNFFLWNFIHHIGTYLKGFWYSESILGPVAKMTVPYYLKTHWKSYCITPRKKTWWLWRLHRYGCGQFYWTKLHIVHIHTY